MIERRVAPAIVAGVVLLGCQEDELLCRREPDYGTQDSFSTAIELEDEVVHAGKVCGDEEDWFAIDGIAMCSLDIQLRFEDAQGSLGMSLFQQGGSGLRLLIAAFETGDLERIRTSPGADGPLFLQVRGQGDRISSVNSAYELEVDWACLDGSSGSEGSSGDEPSGSEGSSGTSPASESST